MATRHFANASFSIPKGTITALVGNQWCGANPPSSNHHGFVPLAAGTVSIFGEPLPRAERKPRGLCAAGRRSGLSFPVLVEDVVMMGRYGHMNFFRIPTKHDHRMVEEALARVNMLDYRKRQDGRAFGGQKERVFLARALAQEGKVISCSTNPLTASM